MSTSRSSLINHQSSSSRFGVSILFDMNSELLLEPIDQMYAKLGKYIPEESDSSNLTYNEYIILEGGYYTGFTKNSKPSGYGCLLLNTGQIYEGNFQRGKTRGAGRMIDLDGTAYEGIWKNNDIKANGKIVWLDGRVYEGAIRKIKPHGLGLMKFNDGSRYQGEFRRGIMHGKGIMNWEDERIYAGQWNQSKMTGFGAMHWEDRYYIGDFVDDEIDGIGKMHWDNGNLYIGQWTANQRHGFGSFFGSKTKKGRWVDDRFIEGLDDMQGFSDEELDVQLQNRINEIKGDPMLGEYFNVRFVSTKRDSVSIKDKSHEKLQVSYNVDSREEEKVWIDPLASVRNLDFEKSAGVERLFRRDFDDSASEVKGDEENNADSSISHASIVINKVKSRQSELNESILSSNKSSQRMIVGSIPVPAFRAPDSALISNASKDSVPNLSESSSDEEGSMIIPVLHHPHIPESDLSQHSEKPEASIEFKEASHQESLSLQSSSRELPIAINTPDLIIAESVANSSMASIKQTPPSEIIRNFRSVIDSNDPKSHQSVHSSYIHPISFEEESEIQIPQLNLHIMDTESVEDSLDIDNPKESRSYNKDASNKSDLSNPLNNKQDKSEEFQLLVPKAPELLHSFRNPTENEEISVKATEIDKFSLHLGTSQIDEQMLTKFNDEPSQYLSTSSRHQKPEEYKNLIQVQENPAHIEVQHKGRLERVLVVKPDHSSKRPPLSTTIQKFSSSPDFASLESPAWRENLIPDELEIDQSEILPQLQDFSLPCDPEPYEKLLEMRELLEPFDYTTDDQPEEEDLIFVDWQSMNGCYYIGQCTGTWKREGKGVELLPNGIYEGYWHNNQRSGLGRVISVEGDNFEGYWVNDIKRGFGAMWRYSGAGFVGDWDSDFPEGKGIEISTLEIYEGDFHLGMRHGKGTLTQANLVYTGEFFEGAVHGYGIVKWPNKSAYAGIFINGESKGMKGAFIPAYSKATRKPQSMKIIKNLVENKVPPPSIMEVNSEAMSDEEETKKDENQSVESHEISFLSATKSVKDDEDEVGLTLVSPKKVEVPKVEELSVANDSDQEEDKDQKINLEPVKGILKGEDFQKKTEKIRFPEDVNDYDDDELLKRKAKFNLANKEKGLKDVLKKKTS